RVGENNNAKITELYTSVPLATSLVGLFIFTTTFSTCRLTLRWLRLLLSIPIIFIALSVAFPPRQTEPDPAFQVEIFLLGAFLLARTIDVCWIGFFEVDAWPRWQIDKEKGDEGRGKNADVDVVYFPLPSESLQGRLAYTFDNLVSICGSSVFPCYSWNWAKPWIRDYRPSSRTAYAREMIPYAITMSLLLDFAEQILCNQAWHLGKPNPITSLPIPQQIFFTILCGVHAFAGNELAFGQPRGLIYVLILRLPPSSSPPVYDGNPLRARSLAELCRFSGGGDRPANPNITKVFRQLIIFSLSTLLHAGISYSIPTLQGNGRKAGYEDAASAVGSRIEKGVHLVVADLDGEMDE
ncbi:hypothetical protein FRB96_004341, partial [Tulasnella sp. 330]